MKVLTLLRRLLLLPGKKRTRRRQQRTFFVKGQVHDLEQIYTQVNEAYFENKLKLNITWSSSAQREAYTRRRLGSYHCGQQLIRIHRVLDQPQIPSYFISYIVYHEMLHHVCPPTREADGRRAIHHLAFKEREKQFEHFALAKQFMKTGI